MPNNHDDCPYNGAAHYNICTHQLLTDAIALLKERQPTIDAEIVVRCQNCKYHGECKYADIPGWFCADGERREE